MGRYINVVFKIRQSWHYDGFPGLQELTSAEPEFLTKCLKPSGYISNGFERKPASGCFYLRV